MPQFIRQTSLSFEQIVEFLKLHLASLPHCLLANDLGFLASEGDLRAEQKLVELLGSDDARTQYAAYHCLKNLPSPLVGTVTALSTFEANPCHAAILDPPAEAVH
ncbi:MAG: hypothetical protein AAB490_04155 [Patescibacteria group bacterium]